MMKRNLTPLLIAIASSFLLVGCCTQRHATATQWEYKAASMPPRPTGGPYTHQDREAFLNSLGEEGWVLIMRDENGVYFFKRAKK